MTAVKPVSSTVNAGHKPVISIAKQEDAMEALRLWVPHFAVKILGPIAAGIPATVFADHPGSRIFRIASLAAVLASLVFFPVSYTLVLMAFIVSLPFVILFFSHASFIIPTTIQLYMTLSRARYDSSHRFWMARCHCNECRGQLVGMIGAERRGAETLELERLIVSPRMRRLGLARQLSQNVIDFGIETGCKRVVLTTLAMFHSAINLYTEQGYRKVNSVCYPSPLLASVTYIVDYAKDL